MSLSSLNVVANSCKSRALTKPPLASVVNCFLTLRFLEFSGMTGILSGMVVAFKQIKPEQEISLSSLGLRVKVGLVLGCRK